MELYNLFIVVLGKNERNKCGGVPKWIYMVGNLRKRKVEFSKRPSEKEKKIKEKGLEKKMKKKKEKKNRSAIWTLLCKVSGIGIIWKEKIVLH